jgi:hypothetical protein
MCVIERVHAVAWVETGRIGGTGLGWNVRQCDREHARACTGVFPGAATLVSAGGRIAKVDGKGEGWRFRAWDGKFRAGKMILMEVDGEKMAKWVRK